jgi:sulfotransferase famil protein
MLPIFFVHIPKTAGTSFRKSAESYFGSEKVVYDYSPNSAETSELVSVFMYENKDSLGFCKLFQEQAKEFLSGHVHAVKYVHLFGVNRTVTFLRDPVQRIMSEYNHFVRNYGYEDDFPSFYRKPQFINRLSKILNRVPLESFGVLGMTEDYDSSLAMLNDRYATEIEYSAMNMAREDKSKNYDIPKNELDELHELNQDDLKLYEHGVSLFNQRKQLFKDGLTFVHGIIQGVNNKSVQGWAWYANDTTPVEIDIFINGGKAGTVQSKDLRPRLLQFSPPRNGYVGFQLVFSDPIVAGTMISAVVAKTGQVIGEFAFGDSE